MNNDLVISYLTLRRLIGIFGLILPVVLLLGSVCFTRIGYPDSISDYYYTIMRDYFVGNMCVIGVFLVSYRGHDSDHWLTILTGVSSVCVALFPCGKDDFNWISVVHYSSAAIFFAMVGYISVFVFTKSHDSSVHNRKKQLRNSWYRILGNIIFVVLALLALCMVLIHGFKVPLNDYNTIFFLESIAVWCFAASWLIKGQAILRDEDGPN